MKLSQINSSTSFKRALNNKYLLKGLETIANHPASFIAGTTIVMSSVIRPASILLTPKTDKENKKYAAVDSFSSGLVKFAITEAVALPVENAIKNIDKNPDKFLNPDIIAKMKDKGKALVDSKNYKFASQLIKLSTGFLTAVPKSLIAVALMPFIMNLISPSKNPKQNTKKIENYKYPKTYNPVFKQFYDEPVSFKGLKDIPAKSVSAIFNSNTFQNFVQKHSSNDANIARNLSIATDVLLAGSFIVRTKKSKKIDENRKNPLIYNKAISTALSILLGYKIDKFIQKNSSDFIEKFKNANINDPKLTKYIQGINVLRPTIIFAILYYAILPVLSVFTADKINKLNKEKQMKMQ